MQKICQQAEEMLSELEGLPLSMARKLDPCELYELLFGNSYVNYDEAPNGTKEKRVHFECCKTLADSRLEQDFSGRFVKCRKPRHRKGLRTFRPVSARADLNRPRVQIKP